MTAVNQRQRSRTTVISAGLLVLLGFGARRAVQAAALRRTESQPRGLARGRTATPRTTATASTNVADAIDLPLQVFAGEDTPAVRHRSVRAAAAGISKRLPVAASGFALVLGVAAAVVVTANASAGKPRCPGSSCHKSTTTTPTTTTTTTPTPTPFLTLASGATGLPRSDSTCASLVTTSSWEPNTGNATANATMPADPTSLPWANDSQTTYWTKFIAKRKLVTGHYTGTTNQIIQWAACKWGISEDLLRAVAVQESDWHMSAVGDNCGPIGEASYGLFQVKNAYCNGSKAWGGYPYTAKDTALNADFYAMYLRSCLNNDFYDGGSWLYNGHTISQIITASGFDYAVWGCVGSWFSGGWYDTGAKTYISSVKNWLTAKTWLTF
jgi:hypothetical protein